MDFTNVMAAMSTDMASVKIASQASIAMLKNAMDNGEAASAKMIESISEAVPSADGRGALMDVRA